MSSPGVGVCVCSGAARAPLYEMSRPTKLWRQCLVLARNTPYLPIKQLYRFDGDRAADHRLYNMSPALPQLTVDVTQKYFQAVNVLKAPF